MKQHSIDTDLGNILLKRVKPEDVEITFNIHEASVIISRHAAIAFANLLLDLIERED